MTDEVVRALRDGGLAIFPTETLWSLSANAFDPAAVQAVFEAKGRPEGVPLAVGFPSWGMARQYVKSTPLADAVADKFLPGPVSVVLERRGHQLDHVAPRTTTLSVRIPDHPDALEILNRVGPCVMTSANRHREPDPQTVDQVRAIFGDIPVIGEQVPGRGSTVVDCRGAEPIILREGAVRAEDLPNMVI